MLVKSVSFYLERLHRYGDLNLCDFLGHRVHNKAQVKMFTPVGFSGNIYPTTKNFKIKLYAPIVHSYL